MPTLHLVPTYHAVAVAAVTPTLEGIVPAAPTDPCKPCRSQPVKVHGVVTSLNRPRVELRLYLGLHCWQFVPQSQEVEVELLDPVHPEHAAGAEGIELESTPGGEVRAVLLDVLAHVEFGCFHLSHGFSRQARDHTLPSDLVRHMSIDELLKEALVREPVVAHLAPCPCRAIRMLLAESAALLGGTRRLRLSEAMDAIIVDIVLHHTACLLRYLPVLAGVASGRVQQPDVINEDLAPPAALRVDDMYHNLFPYMPCKIRAALLREDVHVLSVLRTTDPRAIALANKVEAGVFIGTTGALEAYPVSPGRQVEARRKSTGSAEIVPYVKEKLAVQALDARVRPAGACRRSRSADSSGPFAGPTSGACAIDAILEGHGKLQFRIVLG
mmetsp:Transcript_71555/g.165483  ORF Transcript_71555/g.165483 Transcript_71555/m.165483 type:complete len:384 (-) Transcript_71555:420-1571(-)